MLHRILTALTSKAAIGVAIGTLAAGAAATAGPALVNDTRPDDGRTETDVLDTEDGTLGQATERKAAAADDDSEGDDAKADAPHDGAGRSDSFGAIVSEDARDGGVDGQEISELARERNAERAAERSGHGDDDARDAGDDDESDDDDGERGRGRSDDHRGDDRRGDRDGDEDSDRDED